MFVLQGLPYSVNSRSRRAGGVDPYICFDVYDPPLRLVLWTP